MQLHVTSRSRGKRFLEVRPTTGLYVRGNSCSVGFSEEDSIEQDLALNEILHGEFCPAANSKKRSKNTCELEHRTRYT